MGKGWDTLDGKNLLGSASRPDSSESATSRASRGMNHGIHTGAPALDPSLDANTAMQEWHKAWLRECFRLLPPGGVAKIFSATRTFHRLAAAMVEVGFVDLRIAAWVTGSGFPKSLNIAKAIDAHLGAQRDVVGFVGSENPQVVDRVALDWGGATGKAKNGLKDGYPVTLSATEEAKRFDGWGTSLKPAWEPFVVGRKPLR